MAFSADSLELWFIIAVGIISALSSLFNRKKKQDAETRGRRVPAPPTRRPAPRPAEHVPSPPPDRPRSQVRARGVAEPWGGPAQPGPGPARAGRPPTIEAMRAYAEQRRREEDAAIAREQRLLHPDAGPTPAPQPAGRRPSDTRRRLTALLADRSGLAAGLVLSEILAPPVALRENHLEPR